MRFAKRLASLILAGVLIVSGGRADVAAESVSDDSIKKISSESEWNAFAESVNGGDSEASAVLIESFDATPAFVQITEAFSGTFDGGGHSISGLATSMFDYVKDGTIKNLTLKDVAIEEYVGMYSLGAIVDDLYGGSIVDCVVESGYINVDGAAVGGIAGYVDEGGCISGCVNCADISGTSRIGGVAGDLVDSSIYSCSNTGNITASDSEAGGIAGNIWPASNVDLKIEKSFNTGNIYAGEYAGGIAGQTVSDTSSITLQSVYNTGTVSGGKIIGGIIGVASTVGSSDRIAINNAYNSGSIAGSSILGAVIGKIEPKNTNSIGANNVRYIKDDAINSSLYSVGAVTDNSNIQSSDYFGDSAYPSADFTSGKAAYELNSFQGFNSEWTYWSCDGSSVIFADDSNLRTYKVTYMKDQSEYKTVYSMNTGLYEVQDSPADVDGSLFAGWFTENLGTVENVNADVLSSAADFSSGITSDLVLYPVYLSVGTLEKDPADTSSSIDYDNSGFYLEGAQIRMANASTNVTAGVRFITRISTSLVENVEALNEKNTSMRPVSSSDKGIGYGTVVTAKANIADGDMLVKDVNAASVMKGMYVSPAVINYKEYNGYVLYTALVVGIPESYYSTDIAARPYITYCDANGVERTYFYTETSSSHVAGGGYYTSYQTLLDFYG